MVVKDIWQLYCVAFTAVEDPLMRRRVHAAIDITILFGLIMQCCFQERPHMSHSSMPGNVREPRKFVHEGVTA